MTPSFLLSRFRLRLVAGLVAGWLAWPVIHVARGADATPADTAEIVHVLNRITFGPRPGDVEMVRKMGVQAYIEQQLHPESIDDSAADKAYGELAMLQMSGEQLASLYQDEKKDKKKKKQEEKEFAAAHPDLAAQAEADAAGSENKKAAQKILLADAEKANPGAAMDDKKKNDDWKSDAAIEQLEQGKLVRAVDSQRQLQEVLADFWNNHFNVDVKKKVCRIYKVADDRDVIRAHLWGTFHDLLEASAKSPAMLYYLDNASSTAARNVPAADEAEPMMQPQAASGTMTHRPPRRRRSRRRRPAAVASTRITRAR